MPPFFPDFPHVPWDDADALDAMIEAQGPETIAAFVAEPVIGAAGGALVPSDSYFEAVAETCRRHGVLFIADEVMSGFGRTGRNFGIDHWSATPDILYGGKGMAGGYAAINGTYATRAVVEPIAAAGQSLMFFTFGGQSSHCAVADAVLSIMEDENLVERAAKMGGVLKDRLHAEFSDHPNVADIRGLGLFLGLEFVQTREPHAWFPPATGFAARVVGEALQRDLWVYPAGSGTAVQDAILVGPPFTITEDEIEQLVTRLRSAVDAAAKSVSYLP